MTGRLVRQSDLTPADRAAMFALLGEHFHGVFRAQFDADLAEKNWVVLVESAERLVGFSTILAYETTVDGETLSVIYSGDTIVSRHAWGSAAFPKAWILSVYQLREQYPNGRLIWLLLTSGFRTYRLMPVFWQTFFPRHDRDTPASWRKILHTLATQQFGERFDPVTGIVRFANPQQLVGSLREVPAGRSADAHVAYFLERNPGHGDGDELVCIADLDPATLTPAGRRVVYGSRR